MDKNVTDETYIGLICNGEFNAIPDFKIGELFESFFDNINYNVVKEENKVYVDFTGEAICDDEPCVILIRFFIEDNIEDFEIYEVKMNDEILNETETLDLLEDIAYIGGAVLETDDFCDGCVDGDCANCHLEEDDEFDEDDENNDDED